LELGDELVERHHQEHALPWTAQRRDPKNIAGDLVDIVAVRDEARWWFRKICG
jgi:hypothetical protein